MLGPGQVADPGTAVSPESPLRIPLVRHMLSDPAVRLVPRAIDAFWFHEKLIGLATTGFNPWASELYYAAESFFASWLEDPAASIRPLNERGVLLREVLMATHDYLHVWCALAIRKLRPEIGFGSAPITPSNIDDMVFCHLLTEAAAEAGLDYWYLCAIDINTVCDVGSISQGLFARYHVRHEQEYRRFHPKLDVQSPAFFGELAQIYCTGRFRGFDLDDIKRSPIVFDWIANVMRYTSSQRRYTRLWYSYLSEGRVQFRREELDRPVAFDAAWKHELIAELSTLLWEKTRGCEHLIAPQPPAAWQSIPIAERRLDFRFTNVNALPEDARRLRHVRDRTSFELYFYQRVSRKQLRRFDRQLLKLFPFLLDRRDPALVDSVLRGQPELAVGEEPLHLFLLN